MPICPLQKPKTKLIPFGNQTVKSQCFERNDGLSLSIARFTASERKEPCFWPLQSFSQICFMVSGGFRLLFPDRGWQRVRSNRWFTISPGKWDIRFEAEGMVEVVWLDCARAIWETLAIEGETLMHFQRACLGCPKRVEAVFFQGNLTHRMKDLVKGLLRMEGSTAITQLLLESRMLELLAITAENDVFLEKAASEPCLRNEDEEALEAAAEFLETNLNYPHSISHLSRQVYLNEFKLKKGFRERYKTTVFGYLRQKRMERARDLMSEKKQTVIETANAVGYSNPSHFSRAFRSVFGVNPREYLKTVSR